MFAMHAFEPGRGPEHSARPHSAARSDIFVSPEEFRERVEAEAARHFRYLGGFGLVRIAPVVAGSASEFLHEAVETETRRTDAACVLADGSFAILAAQVSDRGIEALARRLEAAAAEIASGSDEDLPELCAGVACAGARRIDADELWIRVTGAFAEAREMGSDVVHCLWDD